MSWDKLVVSISEVCWGGFLARRYHRSYLMKWLEKRNLASSDHEGQMDGWLMDQ